jgi:Galactose oxidase, central domain
MQLRSAMYFLFSQLVTLLVVAGCSTAESTSSPVPLGIRSRDPLTAARAFGVYDTRIAKLLVPADPAQLAAAGTVDAKRGFDADRVSYGYRAGDNSAVSLRMAADAAGTFYAGAGRQSRFQIALTPSTGARATAAAEVRDGVITYRDGYADTDVIVSAGRNAGELLYLLKSDAAPRAYAWKVQLPLGVVHVENRNDGLWFLDGTGELVLHVPEPYAVDAVGVKRAALLGYDFVTSELRVTLTDDVGLSYPILLDPSFETEVWTQLQALPASSGHVAVHDPVRQRTVLFGGSIPLSETWLLDGSSWMRRAFGVNETLVPNDAVGVWDPIRQVVVAVGSTRTSMFDGRSWTDAAGTMPSVRTGHKVVWDGKNGRVVMFGGAGPDGEPLSDTWTFDGKVWTLLSGTAPPPRVQHALVWDELHGTCVLFGGRSTNSTILADTWLLDGAVWRSAPTPAPLKARVQHAMTWDPVRERVVLFGGRASDFTTFGDTWTFDGTAWNAISSPIKPPARELHTLTWNPELAKTVLFGGFSGNSVLNDSWAFDGSVWGKIADGPLSRRYGHSVTWDISRKALVLFGGADLNDTASADTWVLEGTNWKAVTLASPSPRTIRAATWDATRNRFILFGGQGAAGNLVDTWVFEGTAWRQALGTPAPPASTYYRLVWHKGSGDALLYGGLGGVPKMRQEKVGSFRSVSGLTTFMDCG